MPPLRTIDRCCNFVGALAISLLIADSALAQTFGGPNSNGFSRAAGGAGAPRAIGSPLSSARNARVADERGNASGALGDTSTLATPGGALAPVGASQLPNGNARVAGPLASIAVAQSAPTLGRISKGTGALPNDGGQVWREYDLTPYTSLIKGVDKPEQAVIDWVLRETGTDVWFASPLGILSVDKNTMRVYHTPQVQETVKGIYDRFMSSSAEATRLQVRVITVSNPNWRSRSLGRLKPVEVKSSGVEAWLVSRENAVLLMAELRQRMDFREHAAPVVDVPNGQTYPLGLTKQRQYVRSVRPKPEAFPGYEPEVATLDEGYSMSISPLNAVDGRSLDVIVKCNIDQIEKMIDVPLDIPTTLGQPQRMGIQVPQLVSWRLHERFRWPSDHILLLSCGVVATPTTERSSIPIFGSLVTSTRADALLFIEPITGFGMPGVPTGGTAASFGRGNFGAGTFAPATLGNGPTGSRPALIPPPSGANASAPAFNGTTFSNGSLSYGSFNSGTAPAPLAAPVSTAATPFTASPLLPPSRQSSPFRR